MRRTTLVHTLALVLQTTLGLLLLWWLLTQSQVDMSQLVRRLTQTSAVPLALGVLCFAAAIGIGALRFYLFLPASVSFSYLVGMTLVQNALLTFVPWRLGEMSYPLLLRRDHNISVVSSTAVILAIRLVDLFVILMVAIFGSSRLGLDIRWLAIALAMILMLTSVGILFLWKNGKHHIFQAIITALRPLHQLRMFAAFLLFSVGIFTLTSLQSMFIFHAVTFTITMPDVTILNSMTLLAGLLPIHPPGGWGTVDSFQIVLLEHLGYSRNVSLLSVLSAHSLFTLMIFTGGIVGWLLRCRHRAAFKIGLTASSTQID